MAVRPPPTAVSSNGRYRKQVVARNSWVHGDEKVPPPPSTSYGRRQAFLRGAVLLPLSLVSFAKPSKAAQRKDSEVDIILRLLKNATIEGEPEVAIEYLDAAVESAERRPETRGLLFSSLLARGNASLLLKGWEEAKRDFKRALDVSSSQPESDRNALEVALCYDGLGISQMQSEDFASALDSFERSIGTVGQSALSSVEVPRGTPFSGLRGGAPTFLQRVELHSALAKFSMGDLSASLESLQALDKGPDPDGYPQFWDARAAQVAVLFASGYKGKAELEWKDLCRPAPPPPPSVPTNKVFAGVNRAAQTMLKVEGALTNNNCEDFDSGVYLPCDNAGIPGLGGSSSPCALYTPEEVRIRLWPEKLVTSFATFRNQEV